MPAEAAYRMLRPFFYSTVRCVLRYQSRNASTDFKIWNIAAEDAMVLASSLDALCSVCTDIEAYIEWLEYEFKLFNFCCCLEAKQAVAQPFRVLLHHSSSSTSPLLHWAILSVMHLIGQGLIEKQRVSVECILVRIVPTFPSLRQLYWSSVSVDQHCQPWSQRVPAAREGWSCSSLQRFICAYQGHHWSWWQLYCRLPVCLLTG